MKANAITRIIIYVLVILILLGILIAGISAGGFLSILSSGTTIVGGNVESVGSVTASQIRELNIEWVGGSITIESADTDEISFSENSGLSEKNKMVWKQSGDTLSIQFCQPRVVFGINLGLTADISKDLVITVPQDWLCGELNINSVSSRIQINDVTTDSLDLVNVSGKCVLTNCTAKELDIETVSGQVDFSGTVETVSFETVSANCQLTLATGVREIDMDSVSGDLTLYLPEDQGFIASIDSMSGDIYSAFGTNSYGDNSCRIDADSVSGDVNIKKAD